MRRGCTIRGVMAWRDGAAVTIRVGVCGACGAGVRTVSRWDSAGQPHLESRERRCASRHVSSGDGRRACAAQQEGAAPSPDASASAAAESSKMEACDGGHCPNRQKGHPPPEREYARRLTSMRMQNVPRMAGFRLVCCIPSRSAIKAYIPTRCLSSE